MTSEESAKAVKSETGKWRKRDWQTLLGTRQAYKYYITDAQNKQTWDGTECKGGQ